MTLWAGMRFAFGLLAMATITIITPPQAYLLVAMVLAAELYRRGRLDLPTGG